MPTHQRQYVCRWFISQHYQVRLSTQKWFLMTRKSNSLSDNTIVCLCAHLQSLEEEEEEREEDTGVRLLLKQAPSYIAVHLRLWGQ